jgi:hypothetical protein
MKYLCTEDGQMFLFPTQIDHGTMSRMIRAELPLIEFMSAGFVKYDQCKGPYCTGYSHTLGLKYEEGDTAFLHAHFRN